MSFVVNCKVTIYSVSVNVEEDKDESVSYLFENSH